MDNNNNKHTRKHTPAYKYIYTTMHSGVGLLGKKKHIRRMLMHSGVGLPENKKQTRRNAYAFQCWITEKVKADKENAYAFWCWITRKEKTDQVQENALLLRVNLLCIIIVCVAS